MMNLQPTCSANRAATADATAVDMVETLAGARIQHGPLSRRIYLMKLGDAEPGQLIPQIERKARARSYTKIFAKVPRSKAAPFLAAGYRQEAMVPKFYRGRIDGLFLGRYLDPRRRQAPTARLDEILELAKAKASAGAAQGRRAPKGTIRPCGLEDIPAMSAIYREVFPTYPFPIDDPDYLRETMRSHVVYFCVENQGRLLALSSAEMDEKSGNVEMTDFATPPAYRGNGLATHLLAAMECAMHRRNLPTSYTIARAESPGMNITFAKLGYQYGGRLINNTNISGRIESMNIWFKHLPDPMRVES